MRRHQIRVPLRAIGGRWQLESVGRWAVELADEHPIGSGIGLGLLAVLKALAAVTPAFNERWQGHFYRAVRSCGWVGGVLLVGWGGLWVSGKRDLKNDPETSPIPDPAPSSEPPLRSALTVTVAACIA